MYTEPRIETMVEEFKVLGDKTRLRILALLQGRELGVPTYETSASSGIHEGTPWRTMDLLFAEYGKSTAGLLMPTFPKAEEDEKKIMTSKGCST